MFVSSNAEIIPAKTQPAKRRLITIAILIVLIHGLLLLVALPLASARLSQSYNQQLSADGYDYLASNIAAGHGYRFYPYTAQTLMREPGYPLLLAGLRLAFGDKFIAIKLVNLAFALATAWVILRIVSRITANPWLRLTAPALFLFHPGTLVAESRGGVETLFGLLTAVFMLLVCKGVETNRPRTYLKAGVVLGLTLLVRSVPILFPMFLLGYLLLFERRRVTVLQAFRNIGILVAAMVMVLSPWIVRNYKVTGKFIPTASVLGVSAQTGQYIYTNLPRKYWWLSLSSGKPWYLVDRDAAHERSQIAMKLGMPFEDGYQGDGRKGYYQTFYRTDDELAFSHLLLNQVIARYENSPSLFVHVLVANLFNFWFAGKTNAATVTNLIIQIPYLLLAGAGFLIALRRSYMPDLGPTALFIGYTVAVYLPILAQARYSVPLIPFLSVFAVAPLAAMGQKLQPVQFASEMQTAAY